MPSPASLTLRALRRLVARDPEATIRPELGGAIARLTAILGPVLRPMEGAVGELCGDRTGGAGARRGSGKSAGVAAVSPVETVRGSTSRAAGPLAALEGPLSGARRHRRLVPLSACLLLVAAAAVTAMPPVSAAGGPAPTPDGSPVATSSAGSDAGVVPATDQSATDQSTANTSVDSEAGDGTIYNVIQTVVVAPGSGDFQIYVVRGGDGLNKIATRFGLKGATIYWANASRLPDPTSMRIGLKLLIPPVDGVTVTVKAGNTLSAFASRYKVSVQAIMAANGLSAASVTVGQQLIIPVAQVPAIPAPQPVGGGGGGTITWTGAKLRWPVPSSHTITQYFSSRHAALDIGAPTGSPVIAAVRGTVIYAGWKLAGSAGYGGGLVVWVSSGGKLYTTYNHLSAEFVRVGQVVSAGQRIGSVGMTGNATGPHLHFEVWACVPWTGGNTSCARNPMRYF